MKNKTQLEKRLVDIEMNIKRLSGSELKEAIKEKSIITKALRLLRLTVNGQFLKQNLTLLEKRLDQCDILCENVCNEPGSIQQKRDKVKRIEMEYERSKLIENINTLKFILE